MAHLIQTGKTEAIPLKSLRSNDVLQLDERATEVIRHNGGFADLLLEMRRSVFTFLHVKESYRLQNSDNKIA